ncbi:MAG: EamA family transporter RarD, partial [Acidobacteriota bacterium]
QVLQVSLGYYIYPLVNVCLGFVVLGERLRRVQWLAVGLATVGVFYLTFAHGGLPVLSLLLAGSFAVYGLLRKTARADAMVGLAIETLFLSPLALGTLVLLADRGRLSFTQGPPGMDLLIACAGLVTVLPLLWFTRAVRRLRLSTLGLLQYIAPSIQFLLAVAAFGELFTRAHGVAFSLIWTALVLYSLEAWWARPRSG